MPSLITQSITIYALSRLSVTFNWHERRILNSHYCTPLPTARFCSFRFLSLAATSVSLCRQAPSTSLRKFHSRSNNHMQTTVVPRFPLSIVPIFVLSTEPTACSSLRFSELPSPVLCCWRISVCPADQATTSLMINIFQKENQELLNRLRQGVVSLCGADFRFCTALCRVLASRHH